LLERVDERCKNITQEFDDKITKLETQFAKAELEFSQTRCDIEELNAMEKEYLNQGIQTDLVAKDIQD
ncbi:uncharacterized protein EV154DRAFT_394214, partial [Mucor mucedo]|uniref:uncharacterized protein n=1 Tax=Mucor mucedo TaxID=29922 RepID=UPI00221E8F65